MSERQYVIFDATLLSSLMGCNRYYDLRYNNQFDSVKGKSNSLETGSLAHKILEVYYHHRITGFSREQAIGQAMIAGDLYVIGCPHCAEADTDTPLCKHEPGEYPGLFNTPERTEGKLVGWRWVFDTCQQYFEFYKNDALKPLETEVVKKVVLYQDDEISVAWKSKIDLVVDTNQIGIVSMDHKTMKQNRDKTSLSNQFMGQCMALKSRNVMVNKVGFQTSLKPEEKFRREMVSYSADRLLEWQSEIVPYYAYRYLQNIEQGYWPPNFGHCDTIYGPCAFKDVCQSNRNMRQEVLQNDFKLVRKWDPVNREED